MKYIFLLTLLSVTMVGKSQFHVKVTCNPNNEGKINPAWLNNFVVEYTVDNWVHAILINDRLIGQGFRDDGSAFYLAFWEPESFQTIDEAAQYAKTFKTRSIVGRYEALAYADYLRLDKKYKDENRKHPINTPPKTRDAQCQEKSIY